MKNIVGVGFNLKCLVIHAFCKWQVNAFDNDMVYANAWVVENRTLYLDSFVKIIVFVQVVNFNWRSNGIADKNAGYCNFHIVLCPSFFYGSSGTAFGNLPAGYAVFERQRNKRVYRELKRLQ